jgi:hypothetical protein
MNTSQILGLRWWRRQAKTGKNESIFWRRPGSKRGCRAIDGWMKYFMVGKSNRCIGLTSLPPSWANCLKIWESQPPGTLRACQGLYRDCFTCTYQHCRHREPMFVTILIINSSYFLHNIKWLVFIMEPVF